jgi:hypothetical protein
MQILTGQPVRFSQVSQPLRLTPSSPRQETQTLSCKESVSLPYRTIVDQAQVYIRGGYTHFTCQCHFKATHFLHRHDHKSTQGPPRDPLAVPNIRMSKGTNMVYSHAVSIYRRNEAAPRVSWMPLVNIADSESNPLQLASLRSYFCLPCPTPFMLMISHLDPASIDLWPQIFRPHTSLRANYTCPHDRNTY